MTITQIRKLIDSHNARLQELDYMSEWTPAQQREANTLSNDVVCLQYELQSLRREAAALAA